MCPMKWERGTKGGIWVRLKKKNPHNTFGKNSLKQIDNNGTDEF